MQPALQFSALADLTRCQLVELLNERSRPVHELAAAFAISRPAVSRHLRLLREAGLVVEEKQGRENVYSLQRQSLRTLAVWLDRHWTDRRAKQMAESSVPNPQMEFDL
ncbi:MAG: metalloregulator ArsR/SmtB family transcription factor [Devosia sp.]